MPSPTVCGRMASFPPVGEQEGGRAGTVMMVLGKRVGAAS
jgi:hypothetical protein